MGSSEFREGKMTKPEIRTDPNSSMQTPSVKIKKPTLLVTALIIGAALIAGLMIYNKLFPVGYMRLQELNENRIKWESQNITHYKMSVYPDDYYGSVPMPMVVEVMNNAIVSVVDANGEDIPPGDNSVSTFNQENFFTIPALFSYISHYYSDPPASIRVTYNTELGYPEGIYVNPYTEPCCQDFRIEIRVFEILP